MSTEKKAVSVRDLAEEAKKRIVFLIICVVGLSYLMSLTSSSVWVNVPAAAFLIVILRYFSLDFEMRRKAAVYNSKPASANIYSQKKPLEGPKPVFEKPDWRRKVNSPVVEDAIDHFTRHIVSEWVTDLWYSRITSDRQGPEELVHIINGVLAEISSRTRNVNLIDLLTRDIINLFCTHLELFRVSQAKIEIEHSGSLTFERRDMELKFVMAAENKLHPALFSAEAEHKVLQHLMDGLISFTFKPEDLQCSLFRFIVRELLACAVMRPVLNLASPRFINERIESLVLNKANKGASAAQVASQSKLNVSSKISSDHFSRSVDPSTKGVELVQFKKDQSKTDEETSKADYVNGTLLSKDPLLSMDARSTRSWSSLLSDLQTDDGKGIQRHHSGGEWGDMLDVISRRKTEALAPEHFENMWTKGRDYRRKEGSNPVAEPVTENSPPTSITADDSRELGRQKEKGGANKINLPECNAILSGRNGQAMVHKLPSRHNLNVSNQNSVRSYVEDVDDDPMHLKEVESESRSSCTSEEEEINNVTGLDSPGTKVWDGKSNRKLSVSHIHHPLESFEGCKTRKTCKGHVQSRLHRTQSGRKRSRLSRQKLDVWQEVERTSFVSGDGQDILNFSKGHMKSEDSSDDSEAEMLGRIYSGTTASSSTSSTTIPGTHGLVVNAQKNSLLADSFLMLRCEVLGANIAKSGSETLAVYSISVTDINNNSWSIKRRFRHFEELHRRLKEYTEYNLHLPRKYFLSTGLDVPVIQERCKLLDQYLKKLLQIPTISGSIEVWDFLSVDSQTYVFLNSISIIETLSDASKLNPKGAVPSPQIKPAKVFGKPFEDSGGFNNEEQSNLTLNRKARKGSNADDLQASSQSLVDAATDPTIPTEWVPPNVSAPILDLVRQIFLDAYFLVHYRRKAFWVAKQVLQLGMGDAFDDWLIEKIQLLRRGTVVASGIRKIEQILWPDGIFLTKHPKRQRPNPSGSTPLNSPKGGPPTPISSPTKEDIQQWDEQQQKEAERRAKFVHELMIDKAPAALVGLVGRKEYEHCAKDLYFFLQSSVGLKHLAFDLLELLLLSAFPEMDYVFRKLHEEKQKFGEFTPN
ncbi:phox (PX) domain-containing protein [Actinidia rufa]|uniref:Phox (PX) domain-containing protein n=1 Tax=Actinidia rufa TaxID=165716 RepID=A0A7J0FF16_9ERIC|nr:phox (PX) domain-containing protein [Actinidia rufa]